MSLLTATERRRRSLLYRLLAAGLVVVVAVAVAAGLLFGSTGSDPNADTTAQPPPTAAPAPNGDNAGEVGIWTVPPVSAGPLIAPPPTGAERGVPTGFPHSTEGAISAAARYAEIAIGLDKEGARALGEVAAAPSYAKAAEELELGVASLRDSLGLSAGEQTNGAYVSYQAQAYRVIDATPIRVVVQILGTVHGAGPATSGQGRSSTAVIGYTLVRVGGEWLLAGPADAEEPDPLPVPGSPQAYEGGWRDLAIA